MSSSYFSLVVALICLLLPVGQSRNTTSTYSEYNVPTGTPLPGNYRGPLRAQIHFSPPQGFMNSSSAFVNPCFTDKFSQSGLYDGNGAWRISGIVDRSIIALFLNGGESSATSVFYPTQLLDYVMLSVEGLDESVMASVAVCSLKAAWLDGAEGNGTVLTRKRI